MPGGARPASGNWVIPNALGSELGNDNWRIEPEKANTIRVREFRSPYIGDAAVTQPMEVREDEAPYGKRDQG